MNLSRRLSRGDGRPPAPVKHVHLGLGAFARSHVAWYSERASDADQWGIVAFTGRSPAIASKLQAQGCVYTLVTRGPDADSFAVISSLRQAYPGVANPLWLQCVAAAETTVVTLTVTEAAYCRSAAGGLNLDDPKIQADLETWRSGMRTGLLTVPARLAAAFEARCKAGTGSLTLVSCDNLPGNSNAAARVTIEFAAAVDGRLAAWIAGYVFPADTLVDRITPATTSADVDQVRKQTRRADACPVVAEPFSEWVISDRYGTPLPDWASAGALITSDVQPYEQRKLWLLNGAHSLLAYAAPGRGHATVAEAIEDPVVLDWVRQWWADAAPHVSLPAEETGAYCDALLERWANPRMRHQLAQIAAGGREKLPVRVLPVLRAELAAGREPPGAIRALGAWAAWLGSADAAAADQAVARLSAEVRSARPQEGARRALAALDPELAENSGLLDAVTDVSAELSHARPARG